MAVPSVHVFTAGEIATAANVNTFGTAITYLTSGMPLFILTNSTTISIPTGANTAFTFDTEAIDRDNGHSTVTNTSRYTSQTAGYYALGGVGCFAGNATGRRDAGFRKNGTQLGPGGWARTVPCGVDDFLSVSTRIFLAVNDYMELLGFQNSGAALLTSGSNGGIWMSGKWESS